MLLLGLSVYLYEKPDLAYIEKLSISGFKEVFSSLHIPEYSIENMWNHLILLGNICKDKHLKLTVDLSKDIVEKLPVTLAELMDYGITGLRLDDGFTMNDAAELSKSYKIALNASTVTEKDLADLRSLKVDFNNIEAWHNYYPLIYTGLDEAYFLQQNHLFKKENIKVAAFVMGNEQLRGPMFQGLPTLEAHRNPQVFKNSLELLNAYSVNKVFIGDAVISEMVQVQFQQYFMHQTLVLRAVMKQKFEPLFNRFYHNRPEVARDVVRIVESRGLFAKHQLSGSSAPRNAGDITINKQELARYAGEVQLVKRALPKDPSVLTIGKIIEEDIALLAYCGSSQRIQLEELNYGFGEINDRKT